MPSSGEEVAVKADPSPLMERIGALVRDLRQDRQLSLAKLANMTDLSTAHLWAVEKGKSEPGAAVIVRLCRALAVSADVLLGIEPHDDAN